MHNYLLSTAIKLIKVAKVPVKVEISRMVNPRFSPGFLSGTIILLPAITLGDGATIGGIPRRTDSMIETTE